MQQMTLAPGDPPRTGPHSRASLNSMAQEINALAQRMFDPLGHEHTFMTLTPEDDGSGSMRYRASVWIAPQSPPMSVTADTAYAAVLGLLAGVRALVAARR